MMKMPRRREAVLTLGKRPNSATTTVLPPEEKADTKSVQAAWRDKCSLSSPGFWQIHRSAANKEDFHVKDGL